MYLNLQSEDISVNSINIHRDNQSSDMRIEVDFISINDNVMDMKLAFDTMINHVDKDNTVTQLDCKNCILISKSTHYPKFDEELYTHKIEFITPIAYIHRLIRFKSKDGKEILVEPNIADSVKSILKNPEKCSMERIEDVILAHMI